MNEIVPPNRVSPEIFEARAEVARLYQGILAKLLEDKVHDLEEIDGNPPGLIDPIKRHLDHLGRAAVVHGEIQALNEVGLLFHETDAELATKTSLQNSNDTL